MLIKPVSRPFDPAPNFHIPHFSYWINFYSYSKICKLNPFPDPLKQLQDPTSRIKKKSYPTPADASSFPLGDQQHQKTSFEWPLSVLNMLPSSLKSQTFWSGKTKKSYTSKGTHNNKNIHANQNAKISKCKLHLRKKYRIFLMKNKLKLEIKEK